MTSASEFQALVRAWGGSTSGPSRANVPGPGHGREDRSLSVWLSPQGRVICHSFAGDSFADCLAHLGLDREVIRKASPAEVRAEREAREREDAAALARKLAHCQRTWTDADPSEGTPVEIYLRSRGLVGDIPSALAHHPFAQASADARRGHPAMVALITHAQTGRCQGLHLTYLRPDGLGKAEVTPPRRVIGSQTGAVIRLASGPVGAVLAVAEGIETALSFAQIYGIPTWSCLNTSVLGGFTPPPGVECLLIAADNDKAGRDAAAKLADRMRYRCRTETYLPPTEGCDWNDFLLNGAKERQADAA